MFKSYGFDYFLLQEINWLYKELILKSPDYNAILENGREQGVG